VLILDPPDRALVQFRQPRKGGNPVKKFLVAMLMGAFLFTSMAATIGCGESAEDKAKREKKEKEDKDKAEKDKKTP